MWAVGGSICALLYLGLFSNSMNRHWYVYAAVMGIAAALTAVMAVRGTAARVMVGPEGVVIHNIWRTYHLSWARVESIVPATPPGMAPRPVGVKLTTGKVIRCTGVSPGLGERHSVSDKWQAVLQDGLTAYRQTQR